MSKFAVMLHNIHNNMLVTGYAYHMPIFKRIATMGQHTDDGYHRTILPGAVEDDLSISHMHKYTGGERS